MLLLSPELRSTLLKVTLPTAGIVLAVGVTRRRFADWRAILGLARPPVGEGLLWVTAYAAYMLGTNALMNWRGPWDFTPWVRQGMLISVLRVLAVGILGPISEELIFRGFLQGRLSRTRLGVPGAIVLVAAGWAVIHTAYAAPVIALIFGGGLMLGAARHRTGSVAVPAVMHIVWNLFAVW